MEFPDTEAEREEFQRRSDNYQPDVEGPLVSPRKSISSLVTEYANADPIFITKLSALTRDHSTYRPIKRDGKCGWTAVVFAYFETLLYCGSGAAKIQAEMSRLREFNNMIETYCGYSLELIDFAMDATFGFMENLHDHLLHGTATESHLFEAFNSENPHIPNSIIYHFKLMASAFMQSRPDVYRGFVDQPLDQYCRNFIEPQSQEIEGPGLQALASGVVGPAGINFDVIYLDRSPGSEVNIHSLGARHSTPLLIEVLFRPGHYDLIYKDNEPIQVNFQHRMPKYNYAFANPRTLSNVEAISILSPDSSLVTDTSASMHSYGGANYSNQWQYMPSYANSNGSTPPTDLSPVTPEAIFPCQRPPRINDPIRFNPYTYRTETELPLTTPVFKNSPYNPNHFQNSSFHPQEYHPDEQNPKMKSRRASSTRSPTSSRPKSSRQSSIKKVK